MTIHVSKQSKIQAHVFICPNVVASRNNDAIYKDY